MERSPRPAEAEDLEEIVAGEYGVTSAAADMLNALDEDDRDLWLYPLSAFELDEDGEKVYTRVVNGYYKPKGTEEWLVYPDHCAEARVPDPEPSPAPKKKRATKKPAKPKDES